MESLKTASKHFDEKAELIESMERRFGYELEKALNQTDSSGRKLYGSARLTKVSEGEGKLVVSLGGASAGKRREVIQGAVRKAIDSMVGLR